jgi:holo-[acyl-carrier protein] synthase
MIKGTGIDIVEIDRFKRAIERRSRLIDRVFTKAERDYCLERNKPHLHFAVRFAAKEAVAKSLGIGFRNIKWQDIEIIKMSSGKPTVVLHNEAKKIADSMEISLIDVSLSFSKTNAIASAVALNGAR